MLGDLAPTYKMVESFRQRREFVITALKKIPGIVVSEPDGAFYAFPDISSFFGKSHAGTVVNNDDDMAMYLLNNGHVATVSGSAFGENRCIRISFAASMTALMDAMERITTALGALS